MGMPKVDSGTDASYADQSMPNRTTPIISVSRIEEAIGKLSRISTGEEAARKKLLGVKPIDCSDLLLNRYLYFENTNYRNLFLTAEFASDQRS